MVSFLSVFEITSGVYICSLKTEVNSDRKITEQRTSFPRTIVTYYNDMPIFRLKC